MSYAITILSLSHKHMDKVKKFTSSAVDHEIPLNLSNCQPNSHPSKKLSLKFNFHITFQYSAEC